MAAPPENIVITFGTPQRQFIPIYIFPSGKMENHRVLAVNITYDHSTTNAQFISRAISEELRAKSVLDPPLEVLSFRMFKSLWTQEIKDAIERATPPSVLMTEIRLLDNSKKCREEATLIFHDETLSLVPFITSVSLAMIDLLLPNTTGRVNLPLLHYLQGKEHLHVLMVIPPKDITAFNERREGYMQALILFLDTFKDLSEVFLPVLELGLFEPEDIEEIEGVLKNAQIIYDTPVATFA